MRREVLAVTFILALSGIASANEIVVSYVGTATTLFYRAGWPISSEQDQHQVDFHYIQAPNGAIQADFYVVASFNGGTPYRVFFIHSKLIDPERGIYRFESWSGFNHGTRPQVKTGAVTFVGSPGHWQSYTFDRGTATVNDPNVFVSGGSVFSKDNAGHYQMTEDDIYTYANGTIMQRKHSVLVRQRIFQER